MLHQVMMRLARFMAVLGGAALSALILLTCASVLGRTLNGALHGPVEALAPGFSQWLLDLRIGPITGDFELVEAGIAFAIFAFLPLCQITSGHASVDIFTARLPDRAIKVLRAAIEIVFAAVLIVITWKLYDGMMSKMGYGETTFLLQFPTWWAYAASLVGAVVTSVVAIYMAAMRTIEAFGNSDLVPDGAEAEH